MDVKLMADLLDEIKNIKGSASRARIGVIAGVNPLRVQLGGAIDAAAAAVNYTSVQNIGEAVFTGDKVFCLITQNQLVVLGRVPVGDRSDQKPLCIYERNSTIAVANSSAHAITWSGTMRDSGRCHSVALTMTGSVASTSGSPTITGTGTTFLSQSRPATCCWSGLGSRRPCSRMESNTSLTLARNATATLSGQTPNRLGTAIKVPITGIYDVRATVRWDSNTTGFREVYISHYNSQAGTAPGTETRVTSQGQPAGSVNPEQHCGGLYPANAGDFFQVIVFQNSGADRSIDATNAAFGSTRASLQCIS